MLRRRLPANSRIDRRTAQTPRAVAPDSDDDLPTRASPSDDDLLMKTPAVAEWLDVCEQTLEFWRARGIGPPYLKLGPQAVRYRRGCVRAWLATRAGPRRR